MAWDNFKVIFGGSFDPIHTGHLTLAYETLKQTPFSEVWFIPSGRHRFKSEHIVLDYEHRLELVELAIQEEPRFQCFDYDRAGEGDGSTFNLIRRLQMLYPRHQFSFLIGSDNLAELPAWHRFDWLAEKVGFIIVERPEFPIDPDIIRLLKSHIKLKTHPLYISSTDIRDCLREGKSIYGMVPEALIESVTRYYRPLLNY